MSPRVTAALRRRLDAAALRQLREAAAEQARRIDELLLENAHLRSELSLAERWGDTWRENAQRLQHELANEVGGLPGMTRAGQLVVTSAEQVHA